MPSSTFPAPCGQNAAHGDMHVSKTEQDQIARLLLSSRWWSTNPLGTGNSERENSKKRGGEEKGYCISYSISRFYSCCKKILGPKKFKKFSVTCDDFYLEGGGYAGGRPPPPGPPRVLESWYYCTVRPFRRRQILKPEAGWRSSASSS